MQDGSPRAMDPSQTKPHSAQYFGEPRYYWPNSHCPELMVRRWDCQAIRGVLDVGCGMGHWGQLLCEVLPEQARLTGIDREPTWVEHARARAAERGLAKRSDYLHASAEALPFANA